MPRIANPALQDLWSRRRLLPDNGLTIGQFCQRQGVSTASFYAWKRRLASGSPGPVPSLARKPAFVPVGHPRRRARAANPPPFLTIRLPDGGRILLPIAAGAELVCQVAETVARVGARREDASC